MMAMSRAVILVGASGTGKSTMTAALAHICSAQATCKREGLQRTVIHTAAMPMCELLGSWTAATREWRDGVLPGVCRCVDPLDAQIADSFASRLMMPHARSDWVCTHDQC